MMTFQEFKDFVTALFNAESDAITNYLSAVEADNLLLSAWVDGEHPVDTWSEFVEREDIQSLRTR